MFSVIRNAAAQFIVRDIRPFYAIEGVGLRELIYSGILLGRKYPRMTRADLKTALPARSTLVSRVHEMADNGLSFLTRKIRHALDYSGRIAATADMWTEPNNSTPILAVTVHFFTAEEAKLRLESYTADVREIKELSITGAVIERAIIDIFVDLGVSADEVYEKVCFVTDRGSNMIAATKNMISEKCVAHLSNNVVGHMLKVGEAKDILSKASALMRYVKTSHTGSLMSSKLKSYPETRFNYAHDMLKSIHDNYTQTHQALFEREQASRCRNLTEKITCLSTANLKAMYDFLVFFKTATTAIEGDRHVTLHRVWPVLCEMRSLLQSNSTDTDLIAAMKAVGREYIDKPENARFLSHQISKI